VLGCTIPAGSGTSTTLVAAGSTSVTCDSVGFSGNLTYTCSGGSAIVVATACAVAPTYLVLSSGTSTTVPVGYTQAKIWAVGAGGGGAGGVAYKTWISGNRFGCSGGAAGAYGGNGGNGKFGGDGAAGLGPIAVSGGSGGSGVVVIKFF
jgi:hypothetical protein